MVRIVTTMGFEVKGAAGGNRCPRLPLAVASLSVMSFNLRNGLDVAAEG